MTTEQFELRKARRWPWLAALAVIILLAIAFWWWRGHTQSQQVVFGSTLKIHYEPAMAGEQRIIEYINQHIAPDYGLKLEAVGVQDPVQADRAVAEGQYAGTIYQHQWWLKQVVDANGFALSTTVPVFQWAFGIYSTATRRYRRCPTARPLSCLTMAPIRGRPCGCSSALG